MSPDKLLVTLFGLAASGFIFWFFLLKKTQVKVGAQTTILVDGGYKPEAVSIPVGQETVLHFLREDPATCLAELVIPDFKIKVGLPLKQLVSIPITPQKAGTFSFACGMNMYHGKIIAS